MKLSLLLWRLPPYLLPLFILLACLFLLGDRGHQAFAAETGTEAQEGAEPEPEKMIVKYCPQCVASGDIVCSSKDNPVEYFQMNRQGGAVLGIQFQPSLLNRADSTLPQTMTYLHIRQFRKTADGYQPDSATAGDDTLPFNLYGLEVMGHLQRFYQNTLYTFSPQSNRIHIYPNLTEAIRKGGLWPVGQPNITINLQGLRADQESLESVLIQDSQVYVAIRKTGSRANSNISLYQFNTNGDRIASSMLPVPKTVEVQLELHDGRPVLVPHHTYMVPVAGGFEGPALTDNAQDELTFRCLAAYESLYGKPGIAETETDSLATRVITSSVELGRKEQRSKRQSYSCYDVSFSDDGSCFISSHFDNFFTNATWGRCHKSDTCNVKGSFPNTCINKYTGETCYLMLVNTYISSSTNIFPFCYAGVCGMIFCPRSKEDCPNGQCFAAADYPQGFEFENMCGCVATWGFDLGDGNTNGHMIPENCMYQRTCTPPEQPTTPGHTEHTATAVTLTPTEPPPNNLGLIIGVSAAAGASAATLTTLAVLAISYFGCKSRGGSNLACATTGVTSKLINYQSLNSPPPSAPPMYNPYRTP